MKNKDELFTLFEDFAKMQVDQNAKKYIVGGATCTMQCCQETANGSVDYCSWSSATGDPNTPLEPDRDDIGDLCV